ncbi:poly-gamma-glutamate synthesis protein (capsule biosynthesis protein) [Myceligenerans xiligouense]|uniref:Poly-gamma-glutamate synthesis protein (Capsule biosynthesis protein) n=1 Tax=Myceligenerans xiligouense TaxID=253184 RepID=A0A3N4ZPN5_9MICO|nr:poly-gamma-glutamate synthesis protein (capsule biosynthesis protein) [Myceligenerans xiligouense]
MALTALLACAGCTTAPGAAPEGSHASAVARTQAAEASPDPVHERGTRRHEKPARFTLVAAGDVLPHGPLNDSATRDGTIDYTPLLAGLDPWVRRADLALCHLEAPVAPPGTTPTGYPAFGAPRELVRDLAEQGWDGCSTASNHSMDRGVDGIEATLEAFDKAGLGHVGTARRARERSPQRYTLDRAGRPVTVAHLSATYGLNGFSVPDDQPWAVDLLNADRVIREAAAAREDGAQLVVVSMHAGLEYLAEPTDEQRAFARKLAASREVDLIIGHHAHIPQRIARLDGGPGGSGMWVAYGLGNMISNQSSECCDARTTNGVLLTATVTQSEPGTAARVTGVEWTATTVDRAAGHRLRALVDAIDDPGSGRLSEAELRGRMAAVRDAVGGTARERTAPPTPTGGEPRISR